MGGDGRFWVFFGGIWLIVGVCFVAASLGINLFADPDAINDGAPLWLFALVGVAATVAGALIIYFPARPPHGTNGSRGTARTLRRP